MRHFLSHGGGVNSWAYYWYLIEKKIDFEAVFAMHGADHPKTYEYMTEANKKLIEMGLRPVTILQSTVKEGEMEQALNLFDYCISKKILPSMMFRWCTDKFKTLPVNKYINSVLEGGENEKCYLHIGISADEEERAKAPENPQKYMRNKVFRYMFVEDGITRAENIEIIKRHEFDIPPKSGCYICPFQRDLEFRRLYKNEPCLYEKAKWLEQNVNLKRKKDGKKPIYIKNNRPIEMVAQEGQIEFDLAANGDIEYFIERKPCNCGL